VSKFGHSGILSPTPKTAAQGKYSNDLFNRDMYLLSHNIRIHAPRFVNLHYCFRQKKREDISKIKSKALMGDDLVKLMIDDKLDDFNKRRNQK